MTRRGRITIDKVMSWGPCYRYPRERVESLFAGRRYITYRGLMALGLPNSDVLWTLIHCLSERQQHIFACEVAELDVGERIRPLENDEKCDRAIETKRQWLRGEATDTELDAAKDNAQGRGRDVARCAARKSGWYAAWSAAFLARCASRSNLFGRQIQRVLETLEKGVAS